MLLSFGCSISLTLLEWNIAFLHSPPPRQVDEAIADDDPTFGQLLHPESATIVAAENVLAKVHTCVGAMHLMTLNETGRDSTKRTIISSRKPLDLTLSVYFHDFPLELLARLAPEGHELAVASVGARCCRPFTRGDPPR